MGQGPLAGERLTVGNAGLAHEVVESFRRRGARVKNMGFTAADVRFAVPGESSRQGRVSHPSV